MSRQAPWAGAAKPRLARTPQLAGTPRVCNDRAMPAGWTCYVRGLTLDQEDWTIGGIHLEQLDSDGTLWSGSGPSGEHQGDLESVLAATADREADPEWLATVAAIIPAESGRRIGLVICRAHDIWFHVTFADNRESILAHGLDWERFTGSGIAGSQAPESAGVFLCADAESAGFFVRMGRQRGREVDVWTAALSGQWLISDPGASGGLDDNWMICLDPIQAAALQLQPPLLPSSEQRHGTGP